MKTLKVFEIFSWGSLIALIWLLLLDVIHFQWWHIVIIVIFLLAGFVFTATLNPVRKNSPPTR